MTTLIFLTLILLSLRQGQSLEGRSLKRSSQDRTQPMNNMSQLHKVFVYGTLKRGEPNHSWFSKDDRGYFKFLSEAKTMEKYPLIIGTKYNIPFLLYSPGNGTHVKGELYEVDDRVFANLDILEEHPDYYIREEREVELLENKEKVTTWIYFIKNFKHDLLNNTMYESYSSEGSHGLKYVARYLRGDISDYKKDILNCKQS